MPRGMKTTSPGQIVRKLPAFASASSFDTDVAFKDLATGRLSTRTLNHYYRTMALSDRQLLDSLSRMPFVDSAELSRVLGEPHATVHRALSDLLAGGITGRVSHGTAHLPSSQRYFLTTKGIRETAGFLGFATPSDFVRAYPLSREKLESLLKKSPVLDYITITVDDASTSSRSARSALTSRVTGRTAPAHPSPFAPCFPTDPPLCRPVCTPPSIAFQHFSPEWGLNSKCSLFTSSSGAFTAVPSTKSRLPTLRCQTQTAVHPLHRADDLHFGWTCKVHHVMHLMGDMRTIPPGHTGRRTPRSAPICFAMQLARRQ